MTAAKKPRSRRVRVPLPGYAMVQIQIVLSDGVKLTYKSTSTEASALEMWEQLKAKADGK